MSDELEGARGRAVELLELRDRSDLLDQELRVRKLVLLLTPLVSTALAAPLLVILFLNEVPFFAAYAATFVIVLGAILYAVLLERRRLEDEREETRTRILEIEEFAPSATQPSAGAHR